MSPPKPLPTDPLVPTNVSRAGERLNSAEIRGQSRKRKADSEQKSSKTKRGLNARYTHKSLGVSLLHGHHYRLLLDTPLFHLNSQRYPNVHTTHDYRQQVNPDNRKTKGVFLKINAWQDVQYRQLALPLSWWFLSGCTGRGLDTRLGLLLTLLALTEFIWGVGNLEEMSKPSQQKRRRQAHHLCLFLQHCTICHVQPWLLENVSRCVIPVPLHWSYVWPRSTVAGGAITDEHSPSGPSHITWEDLSPSRRSPPVHGGIFNSALPAG